MKGFSIYSFFVGQNQLIFSENDAVNVLNICMKLKIVYADPTMVGDGSFRLWCTPFMSYVLMHECKSSGISVRICKSTGLPHLLEKYKSRVGLFLGALFGLAILILADDFVWDIRVTGNENVSYTELITTLSESGLQVGSKIRDLDVDAIETKTLLECKKISWITINLQGTYANVQIREAGEEPKDKGELKPSNLIALRDGQIDRLELFSGNAVVKHGDVVKKGDILVSGVADSNHYGMFVTRSSGKVFARTKREFQVDVPFEHERKTVKESEIREKYLIFFSKEIKVFEKGGNIGSSCDTIEGVENLRFFNGDRLPIGVRTVKTITYDTEILRYSENEAMEIAYYRLREILKAELGDAELLKKSISCEITDEEYIIYCTVECIENIAEMREFDFVELTRD